MLFGQHLGLGFAKAHRAATATALHPVHEVDPDTDQQQERQKRNQERLEAGLFLRLGAEGNVVVQQKLGHFGILRFDRDEISAVRCAETDLFTVDGDVADRAVLNRLHKVRIAGIPALQGRPAAREQVEQC